jgi:MinD superfamily P-loop ATPase
MNIAIASGKGGTGKTTVAVNLAAVCATQGVQTAYVDCDVEEPNGHIFLKPVLEPPTAATLPYPVIDSDRCIQCGKCVEICQYNAIVSLTTGVPTVFPEMCHACGGCMYVCPVEAISEKGRTLGIIETGRAGEIEFIQGTLDIGQVLSPPVIRAVKAQISATDTVFLDCPPGTSCPVITSLSNADFVLLVTEPTPFGLHDLQLAADAVEVLGIPCGVFLNRAGTDSTETESFCVRKGIPILGSLPDDRRIAEAYSRGELIVGALPEYAVVFEKLLGNITNRI